MKKSLKFLLSIFILNLLMIWGVFAQGFHVCVASYQKLDNAQEMVQKLEKQSISAIISESKIKDKSYYRVLLEKEFKKIQDARKYRDEVKKYSFVRELGLKDFWVCKTENILPKRNVIQIPAQIPEPKIIEKPAPVPTPKPEPKKIIPVPLPIPEEPIVELIPETPVKNPEPIPEPEVEPEENTEPLIIKDEEPEPSPIPEIEEKTLDKNKAAVLSEETPYSVLVRSYKYEQFAQNDKNRLEELGFDAYLVNTFDEKRFFAFNIHVGAFETREEAEEIQSQFNDAGIFNTEISDFKEIKEKIEKYDEIIANESVTFDDGLSELPTCLPESVKKVVKYFPANKDFPIQEITILDYDNFLASSYKPTISTPIFQYVHGDSSGVHAALSAVYRDELFGKAVSVFFANSDEFPKIDSLGEVETMQFESTNGNFDCELYQENDELVLCGANVNENLFVRISTKDFSREEFINFLIDSFNDKSLVLYPEMRRTLFVLPDENSELERTFVCFDFKKINDDYANERGNADWALSIVGHSLAKTYFNQKESLVSLGVYDLDYDFNANNVHVHFTETKNSTEISPTNKPVSVNGATGWYLVNPVQKEVSFSTKSYVIAIDTEPSSQIEESDLIELGNELKIWK